MVLICLIVGFFSQNDLFFKLAVPLLVLNMVVPTVYKPVAVFWLGLSRMLGTVVSRILLTVVFFLIVVPMGCSNSISHIRQTAYGIIDENNICVRCRVIDRCLAIEGVISIYSRFPIGIKKRGAVPQSIIPVL